MWVGEPDYDWANDDTDDDKANDDDDDFDAYDDGDDDDEDDWPSGEGPGPDWRDVALEPLSLSSLGIMMRMMIIVMLMMIVMMRMMKIVMVIVMVIAIMIMMMILNITTTGWCSGAGVTVDSDKSKNGQEVFTHKLEISSHDGIPAIML